MANRARIRKIIYEISDLHQSTIPKEACADVPPDEFDRWYCIVMCEPDFLVHRTGLKYSPEQIKMLERMRSYIPEHVSQCGICQRRYEAKRRISAAVRSIFGIEDKPEYVM